MKFPVLWLSFVSVWAGTGKVICLAWDVMPRSHITLHFCAKVVKKRNIRKKLVIIIIIILFLRVESIKQN